MPKCTSVYNSPIFSAVSESVSKISRESFDFNKMKEKKPNK